mmetsp:Transcript_131785/g.196373  ORF Transcript_131785/g.196373 Transcript_131785/m.196373 type:complete len:276 (-) Transcript_131785:77-904(-)
MIQTLFVLNIQRQIAHHRIIIQQLTNRIRQSLSLPPPPLQVSIFRRPLFVIDRQQRIPILLPRPNFRRTLQIQNPIHVLFRYEIAFRQDVDVRQLQRDHGRQTQQTTGYEFRRVRHKRRVNQKHRHHTRFKSPHFHPIDHRPHQRYMRIQFDLSGTIQQDVIIVGKLFVQLILQPIEVVEQIFHAIDQRPVGAQIQFFHDLFDGNQIANVKGEVVSKMFGGGIQVGDVNRTATRSSQGFGVLLHGLAVGGLAAAGGAHYKLNRTTSHRSSSVYII